MGRPGYTKLTNISDVRRFLAKLMNQRKNDEITTSKYRDLIYGTRAMREVLEAELLQNEVFERLARLEGYPTANGEIEGNGAGSYVEKPDTDDAEAEETWV